MGLMGNLIERNKDLIKKALMAQENKITVACSNAYELFQKVLEENPSLAVNVAGVKYVDLLLGGVFIIKYNENTVPFGETFQANTPAELEDILHRSIRQYKSQIIVVVDKSIDVDGVYDDFYIAYNAFYSNLISVGYRQIKPTVGKSNIVQFDFTFRIGRVKLTMMEAEVNKKVEELGRTLFCGGMDDITKAFIAHNYLAKTVLYWLDKDAKPLDKSYMQSAYGALINRKCVCQGYAEAYKRILDSQGITCEVICGRIKGETAYHAWNAVSFDNKSYYHVDVTWDAQRDGSARYKYYGLKDSDLAADRIWTRMPNVICNGKENILFEAQFQIVKNGRLFAEKGANKEYFK